MVSGNQIQKLLFSVGEKTSVSQSQAEAIIEPFAPTITSCIVDAFHEFDLLPVNTRSKVYPSTRGQVITNLIWERVRDGLTGMNGVEFCDELHFFKIKIEDRLIIRLKRLNKNLLAISEDTEQAIRWFANEPLRKIPNHLLRLTFGYQPSFDWKSCVALYLTHQASFSHLDWASSITEYANESLDQNEVPVGPSHGLPPVKIVPLSKPAVEVPDYKELA